ncbi:MAG TPA: hypothetical protein VFA62_08855 [Acidimicrobiia bacterium]|nr:hypothetical protein [Acidimicrobiia bacterium]
MTHWNRHHWFHDHWTGAQWLGGAGGVAVPLGTPIYNARVDRTAYVATPAVAVAVSRGVTAFTARRESTAYRSAPRRADVRSPRRDVTFPARRP